MPLLIFSKKGESQMQRDINKWTIYMYTFPNSKRYIGATTRPLSQRQGPEWLKYRNNKLLFDAIQKYGVDSIEQTVLFEGLMENRIAAELEAFFIEAYKTNAMRYNNPSYGYNQTDGGEGTTQKEHGEMSEERLTKLREQIRYLQLERLGSHPSEEVRRKQSEAQWKKRGAIPLEVRKERANRRKMYNSINGVKKVPHKIPVVVHNTLTGETLRFSSITVTAKHYGLKECFVSDMINGRRASPSGYIFVSEDNADKNWKIKDFIEKENSKSNKAQALIFHNPKINETIRFDSISSFSKYFGVSADRVTKWLKDKEILPWGFIVLREEDGVPYDWNPVSLTREEIEAGDSKYNLKNYLRKATKSKQPIITHDPNTGESLRFESVTDAAVYYGTCYESISRWLNGTNKPANGLIVIKEGDFDTKLNWNVKNIKVERFVNEDHSRQAIPIIMHNEKTNETFLFQSKRNAAYFLDITESTLTRWLCGERRPPAGYVFLKAEDLDTSLGWEIKEVEA